MKFVSFRWLVLLIVAWLLSACATNEKLPMSALDGFEFPEIDNVHENEPPGRAILKLETNGHLAIVFKICTDKNYQYLLSASKDKTLRLWDRNTGRLIKIFRVPLGEGNDGILLTCAMSPDGEYVYGAGWTGWDWNKKASVYVFNTQSGKLVKRIAGVDERIKDLAVSPDGKYLTAALIGKGGIRVWSIHEDYKLIVRDDSYQGVTFSMSYDSSGRLVTLSNDGYLRLYDPHYQLVRRVESTDKRSGNVAFSPDGSKIAVGYRGTSRISVIDGNTLMPLYDADMSGLKTYSIPGLGMEQVAWSNEGDYLYGSGRMFDGNRKRVVRRWSNQGQGDYQDVETSSLPIFTMHALDKGEVVYTSLDASIGVISRTWEQRFKIASEIPDFRGLKKFRVSEDGKRVQFALSRWKPGSTRFDLVKRRVLFDQSDDDLELPVRGNSSISVKRWNNSFYPRLNGKKLVYENDRSRAVAVAPDDRRFVLGMNNTVRMFDLYGNVLWMNFTPGTAWNVNISGNGEYVIVLFSDGTIRWYQADSGKELLAVFIYKQGREWIAWTPQGFFDASPGAEKYIGFHLNRGQDKSPDYVSIDQLYDYFYRPDLISRALDKNSQRELLEARARVDVNKILFGGLPPRITLIAASDTETTDNDHLTVRVCVDDLGGGVGKIIYRINNLTLGVEDMSGRGLQRTRKNEALLQTTMKDLTSVNNGGDQAMGSCDHVIERILILEPGENTISVSAYNQDNKIESKPDVFNISYTGSGSDMEKPNLHVIAVGIDEYRDSALKLNYSVPDANAFADAIQVAGRGLFRNVVVHKILDRDATINGIEDVFQQVSNSISATDVFVFYIAAHGITINGRYYVIPQDLIYQNEHSVLEKGLGQAHLQKLLATIPATKSIVLLDTCNSGAYISAGSRGLAEKTAFDKLMRATGRITLAASAGNQEALEGYKGHGVFTYSLLQALSGLADKEGNSDGQITVNELAEFIGDQVPKITMKKWGREQFPIQSLQGRSFPIGLTRQ